MRGVTLSANEIKAAPPNVRRWLEHEIARTLGLRPAPEPATQAAASPLPDRDIKTESEGTFAVAEDRDTHQGGKMASIGKPIKDALLRKLIAARAYELWENQGRPDGCDLLNWHQAEQEIMHCVEEGVGSVAHEGAQAEPPNIDRPEKPTATLSA